MKEIKFQLFPKQYELYYELLPKYKYVVASKGRRFGATFSAIRYAFLQALQNPNYTILWGDTTQQNINRYIDRYLMPFAKQFGNKFKLNKTEHRLEFVNGSYIDFRSADRPENWEGFGYDLIILNEAGIILKNRYLWENSVRPMMLDNKHSKALIIGAPKGKNLFYELYKTAENDTTGRWVAKRYTTYDNPLIDKEEIKRMEMELPESVVRQEIYGEFIDDVENMIFIYDDIEYNTIESPSITITYSTLHIGVDVALGGDKTVLTFIYDGKYIYSQQTLNFINSFDLSQAIYSIARMNLRKFNHVFLNIEVDGLGIGVYNDITEINTSDQISVLPVRMGASPSKRNKDRFANRRAELYFKLKTMLQNGELMFVKDTLDKSYSELKKQLLDVRYETTNVGKLKVEPKEEFKLRNSGKSPDEMDSLVIALNSI